MEESNPVVCFRKVARGLNQKKYSKMPREGRQECGNDIESPSVIKGKLPKNVSKITRFIIV